MAGKIISQDIDCGYELAQSADISVQLLRNFGVGFGRSNNVFNILCVLYERVVRPCLASCIYQKYKILWATDIASIMHILRKGALHTHTQPPTFMLMEFCVLWQKRIKQEFIASLGQGLAVRAAFCCFYSLFFLFLLFWLPMPNRPCNQADIWWEMVL